MVSLLRDGRLRHEPDEEARYFKSAATASHNLPFTEVTRLLQLRERNARAVPPSQTHHDDEKKHQIYRTSYMSREDRQPSSPTSCDATTHPRTHRAIPLCCMLSSYRAEPLFNRLNMNTTQVALDQSDIESKDVGAEDDDTPDIPCLL